MGSSCWAAYSMQMALNTPCHNGQSRPQPDLRAADKAAGVYRSGFHKGSACLGSALSAAAWGKSGHAETEVTTAVLGSRCRSPVLQLVWSFVGAEGCVVPSVLVQV